MSLDRSDAPRKGLRGIKGDAPFIFLSLSLHTAVIAVISAIPLLPSGRNASADTRERRVLSVEIISTDSIYSEMRSPSLQSSSPQVPETIKTDRKPSVLPGTQEAPPREASDDIVTSVPPDNFQISSASPELDNQQSDETIGEGNDAGQQAGDASSAINSAIGAVDLRSKYLASLRHALQEEWARKRIHSSGSTCRLQLRQLAGGKVVEARVTSACHNDSSVLRSFEESVITGPPLPYRGFESVFSPDTTFNIRI